MTIGDKIDAKFKEIDQRLNRAERRSETYLKIVLLMLKENEKKDIKDAEFIINTQTFKIYSKHSSGIYYSEYPAGLEILETDRIDRKYYKILI